jgi:hypothetical protein
MKTCTKCKIEKPLLSFSKNKRRKNGLQPRCKLCDYTRLKTWRAANKEAQVKSNNKLKYNNAYISFDDYNILVSLNCFYCNSELSPAGKGLDRIDSSKGYTIENCVPCCHMCNNIKNAHSLDKLIQHLPKMLNGLKELQERLKDENK